MTANENTDADTDTDTNTDMDTAEVENEYNNNSTNSDELTRIDADVTDVCDEGNHDLEWDRTTHICRRCGLSTQTITDYHRHSLWPSSVDR